MTHLKAAEMFANEYVVQNHVVIQKSGNIFLNPTKILEAQLNSLMHEQ